MIAFGPVPSRRLGNSLGINHILPKHCPYSCVYCQVGRTTHLEITRRRFYPLELISREVEKKILESERLGLSIDYLSLVPDGEPTLDLNLGQLIERLKTFQIPIAVISNASLISSDEIQEALSSVDWLSLKVDAVIESDWRQINRPHRRLSLPTILAELLAFRRRFQGELVTETMFVAGLNDSTTAINSLCAYLVELAPFKAYLSIPTRPPAESWVKPPAPDVLQSLIQALSGQVTCLDLLFEAEADDFVSTGNLAEDILTITAVHPLREAALRKMIAQAGGDWATVEDLLARRQIAALHYRGECFYLRVHPTRA